MKPEYLRVASVAEWLGVSRKRVYTLVAEGRLDAVQLGKRSLRIPRGSVEAHVASLLRSNREDRDSTGRFAAP